MKPTLSHLPTSNCCDPTPGTANISLTEDQVRQMNRIIVSWQLALGSVHDFNHVVTIIRGYCDLLLGALK